MIDVTLYTDAACPWAYSANPALRVLEWRYGDQLSWRLVLIGLRDEVSEGAARTYDPARAVLGHVTFRRRYGMPFGLVPKERPAATGRGCRAVVAARLHDPGSEWGVLRALQFANFTTPLLLDDDERIRDALRVVAGIDADAIVDRLDDEDVVRAYEDDRAEARTAAGTRPSRRKRRPPPTGLSALRRRRSSSSVTANGSSRAAGNRSLRTTCFSPTSTRRFGGRHLRSRPNRCSRIFRTG